jgi:hypothetical protein
MKPDQRGLHPAAPTVQSKPLHSAAAKNALRSTSQFNRSGAMKVTFNVTAIL